jgi:pyruvate formate lyase activating enzyme
VTTPALRIGGFVPFTTVDYPGHLSAVVFCQGCPWRCTYCHNTHLLGPRGREEIAWSTIVAVLARRKGLLDAVVFSGGEPTLQPALKGAMHTVKEMGYKVGMHTAGIYPRRFAEVLPLVDWVGFDVKAPFAEYERVTQRAQSAARAQESLDLLLGSGVPCQIRTTVDERVLTHDKVTALAVELAGLGVSQHVLQDCRTPAR